MPKVIKPTELIKILRLLADVGLTENRQDLIYSYTGGRISDEKYLTANEAADLIRQLTALSPREKLKAAIWQLAHDADIISGDSEQDIKINVAVLRKYIYERGAVKKHLDDMTEDELLKVHRQFMATARNRQTTLKHRAAKDATDALLKELQITVQD